jgi:2'-5' RNA ligase
MNAAAPLILTLKFDETTFRRLEELRQKYFPPERNFVPAHLTFFHALPAALESEIKAKIASLAHRTPRVELTFPRLRFLGKGAAIEVESTPSLSGIRAELQNEWFKNLTAQDRQKNFRPHVTIQNKVAPEIAKRLFGELSANWQPFAGRGEAFLLWQYLGGAWKFAAEFEFTAKETGVA